MCSYCYLFCICSVAHSAITVVPNFPVIVKTQNNDHRRFSLTVCVVLVVKFLVMCGWIPQMRTESTVITIYKLLTYYIVTAAK